MAGPFSWLDYYGATKGTGGTAASAAMQPTGWDEPPKLPEWLQNTHDPQDEYYQLQRRNPANPLALKGESTRNVRSKSVLYNSQIPIRYIVYADGHGRQTRPRTLIQPNVPTVFPSYIGEKSLGKNPHKIFENLLELYRSAFVHQTPFVGSNFLYLVHLLRNETFSLGSPLSVNLPQFQDDAVPDLVLFAPGELDGDYEYGHVVRNPAVFMMIDTSTGEVVDLGNKYLTHTYDAKPPIVEMEVVSTTSPAYSTPEGRMVRLSDVYNIIQTEMHERGVDVNQVALILQSCRGSSDSRTREQSPTRYPKYLPLGGKKKQRRRQTRNRKYKLSKKKYTKRSRR